MKKDRKSKEAGVAIALLLLIMVIPMILGTYATLSMNNQRVSQRSIQRAEAQMIVENALVSAGESFYKILKDNPTYSPAYIEQEMSTPSFVNTLKLLSSSAEKKAEGYEVAYIDVSAARLGRTNLVTVVVAVENTLNGARAAATATYAVEEIPFLAYAMFSAGILELCPWPRMDVYGKTRANEVVRLGAKQRLTFFGELWSAGGVEIVKGWSHSVVKESKNVYAMADDGGKKNFAASYDGNAMPLDSQHPNWDVASRARWGEERIRAQVSELNVPFNSDDNHALIEPRDATNDDALLQREKIAWKAAEPGGRGLIIKVDKNGSVSYQQNGGAIRPVVYNDRARIKNKNKNTGVYGLKKVNVAGKKVAGWVAVDSTFKDGRETGKGVRVVNLYMDALLKKFPNTKIVYVKMEDENGSIEPFKTAKNADPSLKLPAVRIRNGNDVSRASAGITVATHRMAYIEGNYNKKNKVSALIMADNITVLSNGWDDTKKNKKRPNGTRDTYYQAAFVVGGYTYKSAKESAAIEGFQNLVRYRENWGGEHKTFYYEGAYVKLFNSKETNGAAHSDWFRAPIRRVSYNDKFASKPPPGMPTGLETPSRVSWRGLSWDAAMALIL